MVEVFKYLKGYVQIRVTGYSPERFMNLCANHNLLLWNIEKKDKEYIMNISLFAFYKLRPIVKKTGTRVVIQKRYGLPFLMQKVKKRKIFCVGFLAAVLFWLWTSCYIWAIDFEGNHQITEELLLNFLSQNQVNTGMAKKNLDIEVLEDNLRREFKNVTWVSMKLNGSKLTVSIKENEIKEKKSKKQEETGKDILASGDGEIIDIIVRAGIPMVKIGDIVKKGDVLVSGEIPIYNDDATIRKYNYCKADADILLKREILYEAPLILNYTDKTFTNREKKNYFLIFNGKKYALGSKKIPYKYYDTLEEEKQIQILKNLYLPVTLGNSTYKEYYPEEKKYEKEEAKKILTEKLNKFITSLNEKGVQIIEKNVKIETYEKMWILRGAFLVHEVNDSNG